MKNNRKEKIASLIVAAGMSSRMKKFKPLLKLGEKTIIEHVVDTLYEGGVNKIVIVTGNRSDKIREQLKTRDVIFIHNELYESTSMFESVKLGLNYLKGKCDKLFFLPGDIPLFRKQTIFKMKELIDLRNCKVVKPMYKGKHGHPVLFSKKCIDKILDYNGDNGLRGAINEIKDGIEELEYVDQGILFDADTPEDYEFLKEYYANMDVPSKELSFEILKYFKTKPWVVEHSIAVSEVANDLALKLKKLGRPINIDLVKAASLLHDVAREEKDHALRGAKWLEELGYPKVANIVKSHVNLPDEAVDLMDERAIIYLADKLVIEDKRVTLEERFKRAYIKHGYNKEVLENIKTRLNKAEKIMENIENLGG